MNVDVTTLRSWLDAVRGVRVLVVGDLVLDRYIWGDASRISPEAPVPVVQVQRETSTAGGAANVALNVNALGGRARLFGRMGDDASGRDLAALLDTHRVPLASGCVKTGIPTTVKTRIVCRHQQLCRLDREAAPAACDVALEDLRGSLGSLVGEVDAVLLSDYAKGVVTTRTIAGIQELLPPSVFLAMDPKPRKAVSYRGLDLMTPNRAEALELADLDEDSREFPAEEVCARIHERFAPRRLVVTLGAEGMLLSEDGHVLEHIPTVAREVFDVSGAGDTVVAALTLALAAGLGFSQAARFANMAAGVVVGKLGTAVASPDEILACVETMT